MKGVWIAYLFFVLIVSMSAWFFSRLSVNSFSFGYLVFFAAVLINFAGIKSSFFPSSSLKILRFLIFFAFTAKTLLVSALVYLLLKLENLRSAWFVFGAFSSLMTFVLLLYIWNSKKRESCVQ